MLKMKLKGLKWGFSVALGTINVIYSSRFLALYMTT